MSIIGEAIAEATAKKLEIIILKAMHDRKYGDIRSAVREFAKYELVEWYYDECDNTYGSYSPNPEIIKMFSPKKIIK